MDLPHELEVRLFLHVVEGSVHFKLWLGRTPYYTKGNAYRKFHLRMEYSHPRIGVREEGSLWMDSVFKSARLLKGLFPQTRDMLALRCPVVLCLG